MMYTMHCNDSVLMNNEKTVPIDCNHTGMDGFPNVVTVKQNKYTLQFIHNDIQIFHYYYCYNISVLNFIEIVDVNTMRVIAVCL